MSEPMQCTCPGRPDNSVPCARPATQEDFLCDDCRLMDCPTVTADNIRDRLAAIQAERIAALNQAWREFVDGRTP